MFNAFGEGYLCLLKRFLFVSIHRLYFIQFLPEIGIEKRLHDLWAHFFGRPYRSNGTKIHLDAVLHTSLWCLRRFYEGLKAFIKPFEAPQRIVKIKFNSFFFFSSGIGTGRVNILITFTGTQEHIRGRANFLVKVLAKG